MNEEEKKLIEEYVSAASKLEDYLWKKGVYTMALKPGETPSLIYDDISRIMFTHLCNYDGLGLIKESLIRVNEWLESNNS